MRYREGGRMTSPPWLGESSAFEVSIDKNSTLADLKTVGGPGSHNPRPRKENGFENETVSLEMCFTRDVSLAAGDLVSREK
jgi:hypothetical protein